MGRNAILHTELMVVFNFHFVESVRADDVVAGWYVRDGHDADCASETLLFGTVRI